MAYANHAKMMYSAIGQSGNGLRLLLSRRIYRRGRHWSSSVGFHRFRKETVNIGQVSL